MNSPQRRPCVDLTVDSPSADDRPSKKAKLLPVKVPAAGSVTNAGAASAVSSIPKVPSAALKTPKVPKAASVPKKSMPHVLIWVCHHGLGQSRTWYKKSLDIVGVYGSKEEAEQKKNQVMNQYQQCGHGDILVGGSWSDEIDLVIRPAGECTL